MKRAGKAKLPPHVLAAVEEKARLRRIDERAHFWSEVESARTGVGGARSHGRCLPDAEEDLFPGSFEDVVDADARRPASSPPVRRAGDRGCVRRHPGQIVDPLGESAVGTVDRSRPRRSRPLRRSRRPAGRRRAGGAIGRRRRRWCRLVVRRRGGFARTSRRWGSTLTPIQRPPSRSRSRAATSCAAPRRDPGRPSRICAGDPRDRAKAQIRNRARRPGATKEKSSATRGGTEPGHGRPRFGRTGRLRDASGREGRLRLFARLSTRDVR